MIEIKVDLTKPEATGEIVPEVTKVKYLLKMPFRAEKKDADSNRRIQEGGCGRTRPEIPAKWKNKYQSQRWLKLKKYPVQETRTRGKGN